MPGLIAVVIALVIAGFLFTRHRARRSAERWRNLNGISPASAQWLADYRRSRDV